MKILKNVKWWIGLFCLITISNVDAASIQKPVSVSSCAHIQNSGGTVTADLKILTRNTGVSPETVYFSAQESMDPSCIDFSGGTDMQACRTGQYLGFHFNFDDPDSGDFKITGNSKNKQVNGAPRAAHTFVCDGEGNSRWNADSQQCEYAVKVRVQNPAGDWADACVDLSIKPQTIEYNPNETYCVSSDNDFTDCPTNVPIGNQLSDTPEQNLQINRSHSRILYQRGSSGIYSPLCIRYDENNIRVDSYGQGTTPVVESLHMGTAQGCNDYIPTSNQLNSYDVLSKDINGYVTSGWAYGNSVANLRLGSINVGMSSTLLTLHNLDLDWSQGGPYSGFVRLITSGSNCYANTELDCSLIHYPYGVFVSEVISHGNATDGQLPGLNIYCLNDCGMINSAILGSFGKTALQHNLRIMGAWGLLISNSHFAGEHLGGDGPKSKITLRQIISDTTASQTANPENFINGNHDNDGPGWERNSDARHHFSPHFNFLVDNIVGDDTQNPSTDDANWVGIRPGYQYSSIFSTRFLNWPGIDDNDALLALGGRNVTTHQTQFNGENVTCRFRQNGFPQPSYYYDENLIFSDTPDGRCNGAVRLLPIPGAPGLYDDLIFMNGFDS
ncbi:hypothetical protein [Marinicella sp. W31]|uniref:hypothetical protein n=1 Tax=Marinicella sp. W31 TaxID=3023713 RepID=UPI0037580D29